MYTRHQFLTLAILLFVLGLATTSLAQNCPCSIWSSSAVPGSVDGGDGTPGEYGVRFQSSVDGYITGIRFYKSAANAGLHIGNLWTNSGSLLATVTFTGESSSGWQQANFSTPVPVTAGATYVASYYAPNGHYSFDVNYFGTSIGNAPLTALGDGIDGANAVYAYSGSTTFPTSTWNSSNYWVDVVFDTTIVPSVVSVSPSGVGVGLSGPITATFNEPINSGTVSSATFQLFDSTNALVSASVTYDSTTHSAVLQPSAPLMPANTYTAVVVGGASGIQDLAGHPLPVNYSWSFVTQAPAPVCPCSVWTMTTAPGSSDSGDPNAGEYGFKFSSDFSGFITGIRFYKGPGNSGTHVGNLWSSTGVLLASVTFKNESPTGWQQATFSSPVQISPNTTYIASYYAPSGHYAYDPGYLNNGFDNAPLHAVPNSASGNGVYAYSPTSKFPADSYNASNYWVDVVFVATGGEVRPKIVGVTPNIGQSGVAFGTMVSATFNEPLDPTSVQADSLVVVDSANNALAGTVSYNPTMATISFRPAVGLLPLSTYSVRVKGTVRDVSGNALGNDFTWSFTTDAPPANTGPGGPILVISSVVNPFTRYYDEILRAEGLNEFTVQDISTVTPEALAAYKIAILGDIPLSGAQVATLTNWVTSGGKLIAMHPDRQLASLLGLTPTSEVQSDGYMLVNTSYGPGIGIVGATIQYHGPADLYSLSGATSFATLYSTATQPTAFPAVTFMNVGSGEVAAFTYDLARSVVYTRQGNPAWSGQSRNPYVDPTTGIPSNQIRSDDLFYGNAPFDPQPDWVDLNKVTIPQADEQQRLLVNLIQQMTFDSMPLPRFWYFPSGFKAVVIMTGDDHNQGGTVGRFDQYIADSAPNCSVADWQCIRGTSYVWLGTPITTSQAASFVSQGFEISIHPDSSPTCSNWTPGELADVYASYLAGFKDTWPNIPAPATVRTHCITWSDYDTQPQVELSNGIRLDTNYYYWPDPWVLDRPGFFTGSGMPMRFADRNGNTIDVYQATTQFPDETTWTFPLDIDTVLSNATGPLGYYGVFTTNMHTDYAQSDGSDAVEASALAHGVPIVSAQQMLTWLDGRNGSSFGSLSWDGKVLSFTISAMPGARNLQGMLPLNSNGGTLGKILFNGNRISFAVQTIKGVPYAFFNAPSGSYQAVWGYVLSGTISGTGGSGASVTLSGADSNTTIADGSGTYSFAGLANGTYTITPSQPGYLFTPTSRNVTVNGGSATGVNFTANPVAVQSVTVSPSSVTGGSTTTGTVTLNGLAPLSGAVVRLSSSNTNVATVPSSVMVPGNASTATFTVTSRAVSTTTTANITATYNGSASAALTVNPPALSSVALNPTAIVGGATSAGTVTLTGPAPSGGVVVSLQDNSTVTSVPSSVTVSSGQSSATFTVTSTPVSTATTVTVTATNKGINASATLTVNPPQVQFVSLSPVSVAGGINNSTGTVTLNGKAPSGGTTVALLSTNPAAASVPATVTVGANATSATFTVTSFVVPNSVSVTISATYGGTASATLVVNPYSLSSLTLSPSTVAGGSSSTGTVTMNAPAPTGGVVVSLQDNSAAATTPTTVTVAAGRSTATFTITTSPVTTATPVVVTGSYTGTNASATLTINPPQAQSVSLSPSSVLGGSISTGTVTLSGPAPVGGVVVALATNNTGVAQVPASVTVLQGTSSATFTVNTTAVLSNTNVTVSATLNGTASATLTVQAPSLSSISLNPTTVKGGNPSTGTVTINQPAPSGGARVTLSSSNTGVATVPSSVTIPSGATTATFTVTTKPVSFFNRSVTITGNYNAQRTATLTVTR